MYRIDVQYEINVQVGKFLKNIKHAGQNMQGRIDVQGGKSNQKIINVQGKIFVLIPLKNFVFSEYMNFTTANVGPII